VKLHRCAADVCRSFVSCSLAGVYCLEESGVALWVRVSLGCTPRVFFFVEFRCNLRTHTNEQCPNKQMSCLS
jgi:hypothetical protein